MEERKAKILINRAGGNAGTQSKGYRVALPSAWMKSLGITENDREVLLQFDGECVILRRPGPSGYEAFLREARRQGHEQLRLHYYDGDTLCTKICADKVTRCLAVENLVDDSLSTAFGVNTSPTWEDLENFLEERCVPRQRDGLQYYLRELGLDHYDPLAIVRKTQGRMAEDNCWLDIVEGVNMAMKLTTGKRIAETSSKGNQEKWRESGRWYKLDLFGCEGLAETVASRLLEHTNLGELGFSFVPYRMEQLEVHGCKRTGCSSPDFLREGEAILTLAELFRKGVGPDWQAQVSRLPNLASRVRWMADTTRRLTDLDRFGEHLTALFEADMLFGNEDRHLNNIAVLRRGGGFAYCPFFDFGAGLLSNTRDFPLDIVPKALVGQLRAQPLGTLFARQVHAAQGEFGPQLRWDFTAADVAAALEEALPYYPQRDRGLLRDRVEWCLKAQHRKLLS